MNDIEEIESELKLPLHVDAIKSRKNFSGGGELSYIESHHAIREANRIFGNLGWSRETVSCEIACTSPYIKSNRDMVAVSYVARVRVTVQGVVREGIGYGDGQASAERAYSAHELAAKEAESDAMKRALMTFGDPFGLALYEKDKSKANVTTLNVQPSERLSKVKARDLYAAAQEQLDLCDSLEDLRKTWVKLWPEVVTYPADWEAEITARKDEIKLHLQQKAA